MKKKKAVFNFITGLLSQTIILILGLVVPRILLKNYGSDANGLISTISQIFIYVALLEAGIANSTKIALYKPIVDNCIDEISSIMSTVKKYFQKATIIYGICVVVLSFVLPLILKTNYSYFTVLIIVLIEGAAGAISFLFVEKWNCFLFSKGENYIINLFETIYKILIYGIKIFLALINVDIIFIQCGFLLATIIKLLIYYLYMRKKYPWIEYNKKPDYSLLKNRKEHVITEIAWVVFSSTDLIILSIFVSTSASSVYSIYNMVYLSLHTLVNGAYVSLIYMLGQTFRTDIEQYKKYHDAFNSFFMSIVTALMCTSSFLIIPFVKIYTVDITDIEYINYSLPIFFGSIQMLSWSRYVAGNLSFLANKGKEAAVVSIIEASINLIVSIILVNFLGIVGVLIGTVVSLPIKVVYLNYLAEKTILKRKPFKTIGILLLNYLIFALSIVSSYYWRTTVDNLFQFLIYGVILTVLFLFITISSNLLINKEVLLLLKKEKI